jgi:hypothetical protein
LSLAQVLEAGRCPTGARPRIGALVRDPDRRRDDAGEVGMERDSTRAEGLD